MWCVKQYVVKMNKKGVNIDIFVFLDLSGGILGEMGQPR